MRKMYLPALLLVLSLSLLVSCQKEELSIEPQATSLDDQMATSRMAVPVPSVPGIQPIPAVDLQITAYATNITTMSTACGATLPGIGCSGQQGFLATIAVTNVGPGNLPAGTFRVAWYDTGGNPQPDIQVVTHPGIPAGTSIRVMRNYFFGPCDIIPPPPSIRTFAAIVDSANDVAESNENNNASIRYDTCF